MQPSRARARGKTGPQVLSTATFGDLPEPLRQAIFLLAWGDTARWWPADSRIALRLVCREARDAIDATRHKIGDVNSGDKAAALARAVAAGRLTLRELCFGELVGGTALTDRDVVSLFKISWDKLEKLSLRQEFGRRRVMALASAAARLPELRELRFCNCGLGVAGLEALLQVAWPRLVALDVERDRIGELGAAVLARLAQSRLPAVRELNFSFSGLGDKGLVALAQAHWPRLEVLDCSGNAITGVGATALSAASVAGRLPVLRELLLGYNELEYDLHVLLTGVWPFLEVLGLQFNELGTAGATDLAAACVSHRLPKLRDLDLANNFLDGEAVAALVRGAWPQLRTLKLAFNELDASDASALGSNVEFGPALIELDLAGGCLDDGMPWLCQLSYLARLEVLTLAKCSIDSFGALALARANVFGRMPALRVLDLSNNHLYVQGVKALASTTWRRLEVLDLSQVGQDGDRKYLAGALAEAAAEQRFPSLECLALRDNNLGGDNFAQLASAAWPRLETLDLADNAVTPGDVAAMSPRGVPRFASFPALQTLKLGGYDFRCDGELDEREAKQLLAAWPGRLVDCGNF